MNYTELLNQIIKDAQLSNKELLQECENSGFKITPNYLSVLKNDTSKVASDNLSRTIARICGENEELLVVQAYIDKAPEVIINILNGLYRASKKAIYYQLELIQDEDEKKAAKTALDKEFDKLPLAKFLLDHVGEDAENLFPDQTEKVVNKMIDKQLNPQKWIAVPVDSDMEIQYLTEDDLKRINKKPFNS